MFLTLLTFFSSLIPLIYTYHSSYSSTSFSTASFPNSQSPPTIKSSTYESYIDQNENAPPKIREYSENFISNGFRGVINREANTNIEEEAAILRGRNKENKELSKEEIKNYMITRKEKIDELPNKTQFGNYGDFLLKNIYK